MSVESPGGAGHHRWCFWERDRNMSREEEPELMEETCGDTFRLLAERDDLLRLQDTREMIDRRK